MAHKPGWPIGEKSPWSDQQDRPSVLGVARAYPGHALFNLAVGATAMGFPAALLAWAIGGIAHALYGASQIGLLLLVVLWPSMTVLCCLGLLYEQIRGRWNVQWGED